jgi:hypothetical protein
MTIRPDTFQYIRDALHERTAIHLMDNKSYLVETRLSVLAKRNGLANVDALVDQLRVPGVWPWVNCRFNATRRLGTPRSGMTLKVQ